MFRRVRRAWTAFWSDPEEEWGLAVIEDEEETKEEKDPVMELPPPPQ